MIVHCRIVFILTMPRGTLLALLGVHHGINHTLVTYMLFRTSRIRHAQEIYPAPVMHMLKYDALWAWLPLLRPWNIEIIYTWARDPKGNFNSLLFISHTTPQLTSQSTWSSTYSPVVQSVMSSTPFHCSKPWLLQEKPTPTASFCISTLRKENEINVPLRLLDQESQSSQRLTRSLPALGCTRNDQLLPKFQFKRWHGWLASKLQWVIAGHDWQAWLRSLWCMWCYETWPFCSF